MYNKFLIKDFMLLPQYSIFGEYQIICDLKSNIVFKTAKHAPQTRFMCVHKKVFMNLCDLFPVTADNLKNRGLQKRIHYLKAMERLDRTQPSYKALVRSPSKREGNSPIKGLISPKKPKVESDLVQKNLKALDEGRTPGEADDRDNVEEIQSPTNLHLPHPLDDEDLEPFFDDEDDKGINAIEDL
jgi:hypothetical protein